MSAPPRTTDPAVVAAWDAEIAAGRTPTIAWWRRHGQAFDRNALIQYLAQRDADECIKRLRQFVANAELLLREETPDE